MISYLVAAAEKVFREKLMRPENGTALDEETQKQRRMRKQDITFREALKLRRQKYNSDPEISH